MPDEFLKIFLLLSVGQGLTLSIMLLFKRKGVLVANRILSLFILLMILPLWNQYISFLPVQYQYLIIHPKAFYFPLLYGPLLYLFVLSFTRDKLPTKLTWGFLIAGPILGAFFKSGHFYWVEGGYSQQTWRIFFVLVSGQLSFYLISSWFRIEQFHRDIRQNLSNIDRAKLDWLAVLIIGYGVLVGIELVKIIASLMGFTILESMRLVVTISECIFIFLIGFWSINKPQILFEQILVKSDGKYANSTLSKSAAAELIARLKDVMVREEPFLDNDISLGMLAEQLNVTPHHLSQALNEQLNQNFYDFINSARVDKAKHILADAGFKQFSIIDIAYQVGFNNKTSFNNAFKKFTHSTPSQYRSDAVGI